MTTVLLIDGYTDDPASLGVPPYISPMTRAVAGAVRVSGADLKFMTIDDVRGGGKLPRADVSVVLGGCSVPGRYLRSMPASLRELRELVQRQGGLKVLGGSGSMNEVLSDMFDISVSKDLAATVADLLDGREPEDRWRTLEEWERWLLAGADVVKMHPDFPLPLIAEVETYRGCVRYSSGGCSYCIEPLKGKPLHRRPEDVVREVAELNRLGVRNIRLGAQTCILSYGAEGGDAPRPRPEVLRQLLEGLSCLDLDVLHVDNANPAVIAEHPLEAEESISLLVRYCTPGNVLALGMESADPEVIKANNLNATPDQVMDAIGLVNRLGSLRQDEGLPALLPGINLLAGLDGETANTYELNLAFLNEVLDRGLMLRRINIRQVMPIRRDFKVRVNRSRFLKFKKKVRETIDRPMLERVCPQGTLLRGVFTEHRDGSTTFGRQVGSYPLLVGIPYPMDLGISIDVRVVDWGYRSVTAVEWPLDLNCCPLKALEALPGIGRKRAARLALARPLNGWEAVDAAMDDPGVAESLRRWTRL